MRWLVEECWQHSGQFVQWLVLPSLRAQVSAAGIPIPVIILLYLFHAV
jgi:hypothetical protein